MSQQRRYLLMAAEPLDTDGKADATVQAAPLVARLSDSPPIVVQLPGALRREQVKHHRRQQQLELFGQVKGLCARSQSF